MELCYNISVFTCLGLPHFHVLARLPHVLDTGLLGRIINNGRVVRDEIKYGNIRPEHMEDAWSFVEAGLLADRYVRLLADSLSTASFYSEPVETHDPTKVIDLDALRRDFVNNYKARRMSRATHPIMRSWDDEVNRDANPRMELAKVAAVSCQHNCIESICGGRKDDGIGCRYDFPKKPFRTTVVGVAQVNSTEMEARIILQRTATRVPNLNTYFLQYLRR